ncbi:MAG TPA: hypothetical protein DHW49_00190 [Anaerolineae bacterium]|nr:hypothetical protein [Anaerolineae bacterium]
MKKLFSISFLFIFIISCQSQAIIPSTTITLTNTPESTSTPTQSPTLIPTATQTLSVEFPDWVKNPDTQILLVPVGTQDKGYENLALFNAETGERFDIPFTEEVGGYVWMPDGSDFLFLTEKEFLLFSIKGGTISRVSISKESLNFYYHNLYPTPLQVTSSNFTDSDFLIISPWFVLSANKRFFEYQEEYSNKYTSIFDISKNQVINISDPEDEYFDLFSEFSPDSKFLAIVEVDQEPQMYYSFDIRPTFILKIYDVLTQEIVVSYQNITSPKWSPDGTKFLFQEWKDTDYYWIAEPPPCIFDTISGETECYEVNGYIADLFWSPNQAMISFIYFNDQGKGFCNIKLHTKEKNCVIEKLDIEEQMPINYLWSPDSNFIVFIYDTACPYCDYIDNPKLGIANIQTGEYFSLGDDLTYSQLGLWRPSPNQ